MPKLGSQQKQINDHLKESAHMMQMEVETTSINKKGEKQLYMQLRL